MSHLSFLASLIVSARKVAVFPRRRLAVPGTGTSDSGMTHWCRRTWWQPGAVLSGGRNLCGSDMGKCSKKPIPKCSSVALWWHRPGKAKEVLRAQSMATSPCRADHIRCLSQSCFSSAGPTLVQADWLYTWDNFSSAASFATADSATALTSITGSERQLPASFSMQPWGWAVEMRNDAHC